MRLAMDSAMDKALSITEILCLVFNYLSLGCNTNNARVCKTWSNLALDNIWSEITDITYLLKLLAPLSEDGNDKEFSRLPDPQDWARFEKYGRRTRVLHFQDDKYSETAFKDVFDVLAKYRPNIEILPKLHTLTWTTKSIQSLTEDSVIFMHHNVKKFTITIPHLDANEYDNLTYFFRTLVSRMPRVSHLQLNNVRLSSIEDHLIELLQLSGLKRITLPGCRLPSKIAERLSRMEHLDTLDMNIKDNFVIESEEGTEVFAPSLAEDAFPSLRSLSLNAHLPDVMQFMKSSFAPHAITKISIVTRLSSSETSFAVVAFLSILASTCANLKDLHFIFLLPVTAISQHPSSNHIINYRDIQSICRPVLTNLEIFHPYPLNVTLEDQYDMARKCPSLFRLILNCDPVVLDSDLQLPLTALLPFACHCPDIGVLGLFFSAAGSNLAGAEDMQPFKNPVALSVGASDIDEDFAPMTQFLSEVCTLGCEIEVIVEWPDELGENPASIDGVEGLLKLRKTRWSQVGCMLAVLERLRKKDKEKMRNWEAMVKANGEQMLMF